MGSVNVVARNTSIATSRGVQTYYVLEVYKEGTNQLVASIKTDNEEKAKLFLENQKRQYNSIKINGKAGVNPFTDGTLRPATTTASDFAVSDGTPRFSPGSSQFTNAPRDTYSQFNQSKPDNNLSDLVPKIGFNAARIEKKARDLSGMSEEKKKKFEALTEKQKAEQGISGVFGAKRMQAVIKRENVPSELEVARGPDNNAFIIIGNDRVSKPHTGYGGKGHTQSDAIDIVAGMASFNPQEVQKTSLADGTVVEQPIKTNPNFFLDAARIYITQKTDVDKNFRIGEFGAAEKNAKDNKDDKNIGKYGAKSAIALKADNIRVISREAVKIVTGTDKFNSQGGEVNGKHGIELIAMNDSSNLQPLVLGDNLIAMLTTIVENIEKMATYLHASSTYQMKFNQAIAKHTHVGFFNAKPTLKSDEAKAAGSQSDIAKISKTDLSAMKELTNLAGLTANYLTPTGQKFGDIEGGKSYILSDLNKCN